MFDCANRNGYRFIGTLQVPTAIEAPANRKAPATPAYFLSTAAVDVCRETGRTELDSSVLFQPVTDHSDSFAFRDCDLDVRPERPDLRGLGRRPFPAPSGDAATVFSGPVLISVLVAGLIHKLPHEQGGGGGISEQFKTENNGK
jgi:hypothetical protein